MAAIYPEPDRNMGRSGGAITIGAHFTWATARKSCRGRSCPLFHTQGPALNANKLPDPNTQTLPPIDMKMQPSETGGGVMGWGTPPLSF